MAIAFSKYIDITSGVGGGAVVPQRELILRLFTESGLLPTSSFVEMTTLADVGYWFGTTSEEYKRASVYFGFISKNITSPQKISFARFNSVAVAATVIGGKTLTSVVAWESIEDGSFKIVIDGTPTLIEGIDFTGAASYADVASILQSAVDDTFTGSTVVYDAVNRRFNLTVAPAGVATLDITAGTSGTDLIDYLNWIEGPDPIANARFSDGAAAQTYVECLTASDEASDNFGTFEFMPFYTNPEVVDPDLVYMALDDAIDVATWNKAQNVKYIFLLGVFRADYSAYSAGLVGIGGTAATDVPDTLTDYQYPEMIPAMVLAATRYNRPNSVQNYMYQVVSGITATVSTTSTALALDAARINYYGKTQKAGTYPAFYQDGNLMGGATDPIDMGVYANEMWLKDKIGSSLLSLLLALGSVPANETGRAKIISQIQQDGVQPALLNGTISVGKTLTTTQKQYIETITNSDVAWRDVQNSGYWLDCEIVQVTVDDTVQYQAEYTLIYSKNDSIRKVVGTQILV